MTTGGKSSYCRTDATGNVLGLVDATGKRTHTYAYGPTGLPRGTTTEATPQPHRYTGAYLDPTGLYKMGHRYYDPALGRFTQPDPSGQETNPYLYAAGDCINRTAPTVRCGDRRRDRTRRQRTQHRGLMPMTKKSLLTLLIWTGIALGVIGIVLTITG
ncbi:RHS repeat-associated core domain-containing protein [Streptomyces sp. NPDC050546]|uniref:RHS repeat-associated core domain-containing protein n=1 Tax=Streptomyces sp. NPDC050546 TaxID=3365628 RepID=UPI003794B7BE